MDARREAKLKYTCREVASLKPVLDLSSLYIITVRKDNLVPVRII